MKPSVIINVRSVGRKIFFRALKILYAKEIISANILIRENNFLFF